MIEESLRLPDPAPWPMLGPDPKDMPFLALAQVAGAWLVTGNLKHFPAEVRGEVTVISPAEYLGRLVAETGSRAAQGGPEHRHPALV